MRTEFLNGEWFDTLPELEVLTERWRKKHNTLRPHGSLVYRLPAPAAIQPAGWTRGSDMELGTARWGPAPVMEELPLLRGIVLMIRQHSGRPNDVRA